MAGFSKFSWTRHIWNFNYRRNEFIGKPWSQGILLMVCVVVAMLLANLPFTREVYRNFLDTSLCLNFASPNGGHTIFPADMTVEKFINDILMVIFFFCVGLEIRREVAYGELSSPKKALLPVIAAFGGVVMPALIFTLVNHGTAVSGGWGIPTATDIAFAVGILSILGDKVPVSLKVFLTALAVADDLVAILIVALFYGGSINFTLLAIAVLIIILTIIMNKLGEKRVFFYVVPAIAIWTLFYYSGIHSTMSGVVMAFIIPMKPRFSTVFSARRRRHYEEILNNEEPKRESIFFPTEKQRFAFLGLSKLSKNSVGMSYRMERSLNPWVNFLIMPVFALANAGVEITDPSNFNIFRFSADYGSVGMGIFFGLLLGKPLGITLASLIAIKSKLCDMPAKSSWKMLFAVACLGGIGFTMSIFVDTLSFGNLSPELTMKFRDAGKIAVLMGSITAGLAGSLLINLFHEKKKSRASKIS